MNVRNVTRNNVNYNRIAAQPRGWWGGAYGHGFAHGWSASNRWHDWGGFWGWHGFHPGYWWGAATAASLTTWAVGSLFTAGTQPVYYDYGDTYYIDNSQVYRDGQPIATEAQYASQAIQLANVPVPEPPPVTEAAAETPQADAAMQQYASEWMPLGVFAVAREKDDAAVTYYLQLAVSKEGNIAGTAFNSVKDETVPITGSVDKQSQRAAWEMEGNPDVVMETGLFNLTQDTAPALIHFGKDKTETRLLVRMEQPEEKNAAQ